MCVSRVPFSEEGLDERTYATGEDIVLKWKSVVEVCLLNCCFRPSNRWSAFSEWCPGVVWVESTKGEGSSSLGADSPIYVYGAGLGRQPSVTQGKGCSCATARLGAISGNTRCGYMVRYDTMASSRAGSQVTRRTTRTGFRFGQAWPSSKFPREIAHRHGCTTLIGRAAWSTAGAQSMVKDDRS